MHIHGNPISQIALGSSQSTLQATEARKTAADVCRRLNNFAINDEDNLVTRIEAQAEADPERRKDPQQDEEAFRSILLSVSA